MILDYTRRLAELRFSHWRTRVSAGEHIPRTANTVLITAWRSLADTQMYPFYYYRDRLAREQGIRFSEINVQEFLKAPTSYAVDGSSSAIRYVLVQPPLEVNAALAARLLEMVSTTFPKASITYMDWLAPADVRLAAAVDPYVTRYVKKQIPRNWAHLSEEWVGDSNLTDYYNRAAGITTPVVRYQIPPEFENKVVLGSNFAFSPEMIDLFLRGLKRPGHKRQIDLHARLATRGEPWYERMRSQAQTEVEKLSGPRVVSRGRVRRPRFYAEMKNSKLCFSPFGYGEVCWRDYEAYATGALLLKPSMEHLRTCPNSFVPNETYVALKWDLSDLQEKIAYYMAREDERTKITEQAFDVHRNYILEDRPYHDMVQYFAP